jgi:hypothetical protein
MSTSIHSANGRASRLTAHAIAGYIDANARDLGNPNCTGLFGGSARTPRQGHPDRRSLALAQGSARFLRLVLLEGARR